MLPPEAERDALVAALAELIADHGSSDFLAGPILTPTPTHFPDAWRPDVDGAAAMLRRLLAWARLGEAPFSMQPFDGEADLEVAQPGGETFTRQSHGTAAWFAGVEGKTLLFGVEVSLLGAPEALAGVLAHEVAHAWRFHHQEWVSDRTHEEQLTDVTTVFLGAGLLTCNNADRFRSTGDVTAHHTTFVTQRESYGYLSPAALAWLLAVQVAARGDSNEMNAVEAALERNQRAAFREALKVLGQAPEELERKLGLPPREKRLTPSPLVAPPRLELPPAPPPPAPVAPPPPIGFRMLNDWPWRFFGWGAISSVASVAAAAVLQIQWLTVLALVGPVLGRLIRYRVCTGCESRVEDRAERCEVCGSRLVGDIDTLRDRHDAEDAWRARQADPTLRAEAADVAALEAEALGAKGEDAAHP